MFWRKVHEKFAIVHSQTPISVKQNEQVRSMDQLMNRFNRHIKVDIMVYNKHYIHIHKEKPSGVPEDQYPELICARYKEVEGKSFRFGLHSVLILSIQCQNSLLTVLQPWFQVLSTPIGRFLQEQGYLKMMMMMMMMLNLLWW
jgi:hypothetical protein